jgi:hypothetical protein
MLVQRAAQSGAYGRRELRRGQIPQDKVECVVDLAARLDRHSSEQRDALTPKDLEGIANFRIGAPHFA